MSNNNETAELPLVTFALFTYNQEQFVVDAIESAFAQTYEPLEIIISDDCSTDHTFEIIQECVAYYNGAHRVIVRKTPHNIGTFAHVMDVVKNVQGQMVVLAAGDDISKPQRVTKLAEAWQSTKAWGLHSKFDRIDEDGYLLGESELSEGLLLPEYRLRQYFYKEDGPVDIVHGVGSAYDVRIFEYLKGYADEFILSEDGVLSFALNLFKKKIYLLDESLVCYREHQGSLTNSGRKVYDLSVEDIIASEQKNVMYSTSLANRTKMFLTLVDDTSDSLIRPVNRDEIIHDNKICSFKASWMQSSFIDRSKFLFFYRKGSELSWILPRLFGAKFFRRIKSLFRNLKQRNN